MTNGLIEGNDRISSLAVPQIAYTCVPWVYAIYSCTKLKSLHWYTDIWKYFSSNTPVHVPAM